MKKQITIAIEIMKKSHLIILILIVTSTLLKAQFTTNGASTDYTSTTAWTGGAVPDMTFWDGSHDVEVSHILNRTVGTFTITSNNVLTIKSGGDFTINGDLSIGNNGSVIIESGGVLTVTGNVTMGFSSSYTSNAGGTFTTNGNFTMVGGSDADMNGTNTIAGTLDVSGSGADFDLNGGTLDVTTDANFTGDGNVTVAGDLNVGGDMDVTGSGGASVSLLGTIDVTSGTLTIDNDGVIDGTGTIGWSSLSANPSCSDAIITCDGTGTSLDNNSGGGCGGSYAAPPGSPLSLNTCAIGTLPIELLNFTIVEQGQVNEVYWTTGLELNNEYFEILGSTNGIDWEVLNTTQGAGTSYQLTRYHQIVAIGMTYFKLRQTDYDGTSKDSKIISLDNKTSRKPLEITNNADVIFVKNAKGVNLNIFDLSGRSVFNYSITNNFEVINTATLKSGIYIVTAGQFSSKISVK